MKTHRVMRTIHICTSLLLLPWLLVYSTSAFFLNHHELFKERMQEANKFAVVSERQFTPDSAFPNDAKEQAKALLKLLDLEGPHHVRGRPTAARLTVIRQSAAGPYRILWLRDQSKVVVERQPFSFWRLVTYLHFRHGYRTPYLSLDVWALVVDALIVSIWLWGISGVYMWAAKGGKKRLGAVSLGAGVALFAVLVVLMSR